MTVGVILAAGVGSRLRPLTEALPKCLVPLTTETILGRMVRLLVEAGVSSLVVSTGFEAPQVEAALARCPVPVRCVHNPDYDRVQNVVSLHRALEAAPPGDFVKLDGDVVFQPAVLSRLLGARGDAQGLGWGDGRVALDDRVPPRDEAMKVEAPPGNPRGALRFGKALDPARCTGESIGIEWFGAAARGALAAALASAVAAGHTDLYYEDVYASLVAQGQGLVTVPVGDLDWTEVDDLTDLARARDLVQAWESPRSA